MHRRVAAAVAAVLALGVASCGESSEPLTRAQLQNRIEAACRQAAQRAQDGGRTADDFFAMVLTAQRDLVERVEGLDPPDELSDTVERLQEGLTQRADAIADVADAPRGEQQRAAASINERLEAITRDVEAALSDLGVRGCA